MGINDAFNCLTSHNPIIEPQDMPLDIHFMTEEEKELYIENTAHFNDSGVGYVCPTCGGVYLDMHDALYCCITDCYETLYSKERRI